MISEKQDSSLGSINANGATVARSDDNFYSSENYPSRWLQMAWWRYMTARWGCYTSLHSWELCNEGDPFDSNHYDAANALATYVHSIDPNKAMCTTSFWHSIPGDFWKSSSCDYIDVHEYLGPTTPADGSNGPRFYAWTDPYSTDNNASVNLPYVQSAGTLDLDLTVFHSGKKSLKLIGNAGSGNVGRAYLYPEYHVGINPSHTYTLRFWGKASNVGNPGGNLASVGPGIEITWSKAYHENDWAGSLDVYMGLGTYDWRMCERDHIVPSSSANTANICPIISVTPAGPGTFWVDDIQFIDEMTGENLFVDGGFEGDRIDYDPALAVMKYGVLLDSYGARMAKPTVWGETGIRGLNELGDPYEGYSYTNENQHLVDDVGGVYLRKMIWENAGPYNPNMLLWWTDNIVKKDLWGYFKAFQAFMSSIPVTNGSYRDVLATTSVSALRACGQKDLTNNCAYLWIDNAPYTWNNIVDGVSVPAVTGTVTVSGLKDGNYQVEWWDTGTGLITQTNELPCSGGNLVLSVQNLLSDVACRYIQRRR